MQNDSNQSGLHPDTIKRMAAAMQSAKDDERRFLGAWKRGVELAGKGYFHVRSDSVAEASDKDDLRPDWEHIKAVIGGLSHGEQVFLASMYSFFNAEDGQLLFDMLAEPANPCAIARILDADRAQVIADLLITYRGW